MKVGLDTANMTIDRMEKEAVMIKQQLIRQEDFEAEDVDTRNIGNKIYHEHALKLKDDELTRKTLEAKELASQMYDDKQTIAILEDRLRDLNFNLHQKNTELASIKTMAAVRSDGQDRELTELKEKVCLNH